MPNTTSAGRALPDGSAIEAYKVELDVLGRIARSGQSAWDALAAEALTQKCFDADCAIADGDAVEPATSKALRAQTGIFLKAALE